MMKAFNNKGINKLKKQDNFDSSFKIILRIKCFESHQTLFNFMRNLITRQYIVVYTF